MISFINQLRTLSAADPDFVAVTCQEESISRAELLRRGGDLAVHLQSLGVKFGDLVTVAVPNSIDWFVSYVAIWMLGATPQPVSSRLPQRELDALIELADPPVVIGVAVGAVSGRPTIPVGFRAPAADASHLPDVISPAWKAPTSGGSTGRPKLIVSGDPVDAARAREVSAGTRGLWSAPRPRSRCSWSSNAR